MAAIRQRNDPVRSLWRRLLIAGLIVLVFFGTWAVWDVYWKERESRTFRMQAENELRDLSAREKNLAVSIASLETERGKEEALRDAYEVSRSGEGIVVIVDRPATTTVQNTAEHQNWLERIFWWW